MTEPLECLETLEPRERWEPEETRDPGGWLGRMGCRARPDLRGRKGEWETWGNPGCRARRETLVRQGRWDPPAYRELQACPGSRASKASLACRETPDLRGGKETPGRLGRTGRTEWTGSRG